MTFLGPVQCIVLGVAAGQAVIVTRPTPAVIDLIFFFFLPSTRPPQGLSECTVYTKESDRHGVLLTIGRHPRSSYPGPRAFPLAGASRGDRKWQLSR